MGMYVSARGWIEIDAEQRASAEEVLRRHEDGHYSGGWAFPAHPVNWTRYLFYGGDLREGQLPWLRAQLAELAALPAVDEDGDRPRGLFLITDERGGAVTWQIRDATLRESPAPSLSWLAE
ncbi:hypothetical protein ACTOB_004165 [Actinoplanes oblitus]|uniref:Uncharacterized protein n=1 Tax=Actinoplanes oblitus TaxID=3040509 RepID=A0ABY8WW93_9ACTN|nr:hypothetical protein [Actinoplanes oblitus]WIN00456.1 hypothetical protein ACTOB_004165 [Actinoplanes oblitus]